MRTILTLALALALALPLQLLAADQVIVVKPYEPPAPTVSITLHDRHGHVTPASKGCVHTGGGNIDVAQPTPDVLVVTMTGVAVATPNPLGPATASLDFDLAQCLEVVFEKPEVKKAKLTMEARVIGLLRSEKVGSAEEHGTAGVLCASAPLVTITAPPHSVACGESLSINDHEGPISVPVQPGQYTLQQNFHVSAAAPKSVLPCKAPSAEFAPDPALDPLWISYKEPFHGAIKKDFGFQVTIKVAPDEDKPEEKLPEPKPEPKPDAKPDVKPAGKVSPYR
jgi:hypothetical protein